MEEQGSDVELTPALRGLVENVKTGDCVLFLGAGVHAPPPEGCCYVYPEEQRPPLGGALSEKLAGEFSYMKRFPQESPRDLQRVSLYIETEEGLGRKKLVDALEQHLSGDKKPSPALLMLAGMPFRIFITTNYDRLLEAALATYGKDPDHFVYNPQSDVPTPDMSGDPTSTRPLLYKMHGDLKKRDSIVITDEDYITFIQRMTENDPNHPVPMTVRYRMKRWPTLFIGYSLRDYNLRLLFRTLRLHVDKADFPTSYAVDRNPDPLILQVWQNERRIITFIAQDLWTFVPWLYRQVTGEEFLV